MVRVRIYDHGEEIDSEAFKNEGFESADYRDFPSGCKQIIIKGRSLDSFNDEIIEKRIYGNPIVIITETK